MNTTKIIKLKIVHIITGLGNGGAEAVLYRLCKNTVNFDHMVISLSCFGKYGSKIKALGIPVEALNLSISPTMIKKFVDLIKMLRNEKPDIVQTWMYHADFFGGIAARFAGVKNIIWGIRNSSLKINKAKLTTIFLVRFLAFLSRFVPKQVLACARSAAKIHQQIGYDAKKIIVINNGVDTKVFRPFSDCKKKYKKKLNLPNSDSIPLIGSVSRFDPQKNHEGLLDSLMILKERKINFICLLIGSGLARSNKILNSWILHRKLSDNIRLLGQQENIPFFMNVLDLHILQSSYGEAFPNVVAEAMACGTPCIVTDVGDSSEIVGKTGWVVPPDDPLFLANTIEIALNERLTNKWKKRKENSRKRIEENFNQKKMISNFGDCWKAFKNT